MTATDKKKGGRQMWELNPLEELREIARSYDAHQGHGLDSEYDFEAWELEMLSLPSSAIEYMKGEPR